MANMSIANGDFGPQFRNLITEIKSIGICGDGIAHGILIESVLLQEDEEARPKTIVLCKRLHQFLPVNPKARDFRLAGGMALDTSLPARAAADVLRIRTKGRCYRFFELVPSRNKVVLRNIMY